MNLPATPNKSHSQREGAQQKAARSLICAQSIPTFAARALGSRTHNARIICKQATEAALYERPAPKICVDHLRERNDAGSHKLPESHLTTPSSQATSDITSCPDRPVERETLRPHWLLPEQEGESQSCHSGSERSCGPHSAECRGETALPDRKTQA